MIRKVLQIATNTDYRFQRNAALGRYQSMSDEEYLTRLYKAKMGRTLNLNNPQTFNEKLQWLKIHDRKPIYTSMVDKLEAKDFVAERIGEKYIIKTLGVWNRFDQIDFDSLPNKFVLKCTHDSGGVVICRDKSKFDIAAAKKKIESSLARNYYTRYREWPYKDVHPMIIAEEYMENINTSEPHSESTLIDYKLQCFDGKFDNILVVEGRFSEHGPKYYYFDRTWKYIPYCPYDDIVIDDLKVLKPKCYEEMISISEKLSKGVPQLRVDLYEINNKVYFGEMTFYSQSGFDTDITYEADCILGSKLTLPEANA